MIDYPDSFWRHTIRVTPNTWDNTDASLGPEATPGTPVVYTQANIQDVPTLAEKTHLRTEIHDADTQTRVYMVFCKVNPNVSLQDKIEQLDANGNVLLALTAKSAPTDRGTFGVAWRFEAQEVK